MAGINLPPQAYTAEVLARAYEWLKDQPPSIRELATSADILVGLYTRAKRSKKRGPYDLAPVSAKEFLADLKNLAKNLNEFDGGDKPNPVTPQPTTVRTEPIKTKPPAQQPIPTAPAQAPAAMELPTPAAPAAATPEKAQPSRAAVTPITVTPITARVSPQPQTSMPRKPMPSSMENYIQNDLDQRTQEMLRAVAQKLNLSSEREALRMLVTLGYETIKEILPPS